MNELIKIVNQEPVLETDAVETLIALEERIKIIKTKQEEYKKSIKEEMEAKGIISLKTNRLSITYVPEQVNLEKFNKELFQEEMPDTYDKYITMDGKRASYIVMKVK